MGNSAPGLSGLAGLAEGFANAWTTQKRLSLEDEINRRHELASVYTSALPNVRPEAQQQILSNLASIYTTPIHKKLDKSVTDISSLYQPPQGMQQSQAGALTSGAAQQPSVSPAMPQQSVGQMAPPPPGMFGAGAPQTQPPPVNMTAQTATMPQLGQLTPPALSATGYTPFFTPEERAGQEAYSHSLTAGADVQAQIDARRKIGEGMGLQGDELARFSLGALPLIRQQAKAYVTPDAPNTPKYGNYDPISGTWTDASGQPIPNAQPYEASLQPTTEWRAFMQAGLAQGQPIEQIVQEYNTRVGVSQGVRMEQQPDGSIVAVPITTTTTSTRGTLTPPGGTAQTPGAPSAAGAGAPGRVVGGQKASPQEIKTTQQNLGQINLAIPRLQNLLDHADIISNMIDAGRIAFAIGADGTLQATVGRGVTLTPEEAKFASDFQTMSEDINLLRAPLGATGFRGAEAFGALQAQRGRLAQNPAVFKGVLANTLASMQSLQQTDQQFMDKYSPSKGKLTPPQNGGGGGDVVQQLINKHKGAAAGAR